MMIPSMLDFFHWIMMWNNFKLWIGSADGKTDINISVDVPMLPFLLIALYVLASWAVSEWKAGELEEEE